MSMNTYFSSLLESSLINTVRRAAIENNRDDFNHKYKKPRNDKSKKCNPFINIIDFVYSQGYQYIDELLYIFL